MRILADSPSGRRLRRHGVSSNALSKTRVYPVGWLTGIRVTVPLPLFGTAVFIKRDMLKWDAEGELAEGPELAPLVHQLCHAHQRLEWGLVRYLWRHLRARLRRGYGPIRFSQVERECYEAARQTVEYYQQERNGYPEQVDSQSRAGT